MTRVLRNNKASCFIALFIYVLILILAQKFTSIKAYILFDTKDIQFKDLLSIGLTILSISYGAIITSIIVLLSMCNARLMKLLHKYDGCKYLKSCIYTVVIAGIVDIFVFAIIYASLHFKCFWVRMIFLFIAVFSSCIFIENSISIIKIVIKLLVNSLNMNDFITKNAEFVNPNDKNKEK